MKNSSKFGFFLFQFICVGLLGQSLLGCAAQKPHYHEDWPTLHHNSAHYSALESGPAPPFKTAWHFQTKGRLLYPPVASKDTLYLGSRDSHIYAVDVKTGVEKWSEPMDVGGLFSSPLLLQGKLYGGRWSPFYHIYSWDASTGEALWKKETGDLVNRPPWVIGSEGSLFSHQDPPIGASEEQKVVQTAWDLLPEKQPSLRWKKPLPGIPKVSPALSGRFLFTALDNKELYALDTQTGNILWKATLVGEPASTPLIRNRTLFLSTRNGYIYAFDAPTGKVKWRYQFVNESLRGDMALAEQQLLIPGAKMLYTFDIGNREPGWKYRFPGLITSPVVSKKHVYVGSSTRALYVMNRKKGYVLGSHVLPGEVLASPILLQGKVFVSSSDGKLYALEEGPRPKQKKIEVSSPSVPRRKSTSRW